ncbi:hypothetical protein D3C85_1728760 [compost metagenome]
MIVIAVGVLSVGFGAAVVVAATDDDAAVVDAGVSLSPHAARAKLETSSTLSGIVTKFLFISV